MNTKIEKIQKSSNAALVVAKIVRIFAIVMAVILFLAGAVFIGMSDFLNKEFAKAVKAGALLDGELEIGMAGMAGAVDLLIQRILPDNIAVSLGIDMFVMGVIMVILAVLMYFVGRVFKDMKEGYSPFQPSIIKNMKIAFVIITVLSLDSSLLIGALIGFSLWCVINVFEYGCELQRQSDETL